MNIDNQLWYGQGISKKHLTPQELMAKVHSEFSKLNYLFTDTTWHHENETTWPSNEDGECPCQRVSQPFYATNKLWDVKEHTHCSQRVGHVVPGVVVYLDLCRRRSGWVRCDHNGLKRLPEAPLICWRPISPLWFLCNSALGCKWGNWHHSSLSHLSHKL